MTNITFEPQSVAVFTRGLAREDDYRWRFQQGELICFEEVSEWHAKLLTAARAEDREPTPFAVLCDPDRKVVSLVVERLRSPRSEKAGQVIDDGLYCEFPLAHRRKVARLAAALLGDDTSDLSSRLAEYAEARLAAKEDDSLGSFSLAISDRPDALSWRPNKKHLVRRSTPVTRGETAHWLLNTNKDRHLICISTAGSQSPSRIGGIRWDADFQVVVLSSSEELTDRGREIELASKPHSSPSSGFNPKTLMQGLIRDRKRWGSVLGLLLLANAVWFAFPLKHEPPSNPTSPTALVLIRDGREEPREVSERPGPLTVRIPNGEKAFSIRLTFSESVSPAASLPHVTGPVKLTANNWSADRRTLQMTLETTPERTEEPAVVRLTGLADGPERTLDVRLVFDDENKSARALVKEADGT